MSLEHMVDWEGIKWDSLIFFAGYHLGLLIALPWYFIRQRPSVSLILISLVLLFVTCISVTAGYHRYYAHKSYKMNKGVEAVLLFFSTLAGQMSVLKWACDHRLHHAFVDTDKDPYSIKKGFWYAHILWLFRKEERFDAQIVSDLMKNKLLRFQDKYYSFLFFGTNIGVWLFVGWMVKDFLGAFLITWWLRLFMLHHFTFFINSLAHFWGERTYSKEASAVDNFIISLVTFGEGYHNYHHAFARDYRNGVRWYHFDPTKWLIWSLQKFNMAKGLYKVNSYNIKKRLVLADRSLLLQNIKEIVSTQKAKFEQRITTLSDRLTATMTSIEELRQKYRELKIQKKEKWRLMKKRHEIKVLKKSMKRDFRAWFKLCRQVLRQPAVAKL